MEIKNIQTKNTKFIAAKKFVQNINNQDSRNILSETSKHKKYLTNENFSKILHAIDPTDTYAVIEFVKENRDKLSKEDFDFVVEKIVYNFRYAFELAEIAEEVCFYNQCSWYYNMDNQQKDEDLKNFISELGFFGKNIFFDHIYSVEKMHKRPERVDYSILAYALELGLEYKSDDVCKAMLRIARECAKLGDIEDFKIIEKCIIKTKNDKTIEKLEKYKQKILQMNSALDFDEIIDNAIKNNMSDGDIEDIVKVLYYYNKNSINDKQNKIDFSKLLDELERRLDINYIKNEYKNEKREDPEWDCPEKEYCARELKYKYLRMLNIAIDCLKWGTIEDFEEIEKYVKRTNDAKTIKKLEKCKNKMLQNIGNLGSEPENE